MLRLTDAFDNPELADVEVKATVLNINYGHNRELLEKCRTLKEYSELIQMVRENEKTMYIEDAIDAAVNDCIDRGILKVFLESHRAEVKEMFALEYHEELTMRDLREQAIKEGLEEGRAKGLAEGREKGRAEGRAEGVFETLDSLVKDGILTVEAAAERAGVTEAVFLKKCQHLDK